MSRERRHCADRLALTVSRLDQRIALWTKIYKTRFVEVADVYKADSIPWCGMFWALSWSAFGAKSPAPALGDVLGKSTSLSDRRPPWLGRNEVPCAQ